MHTSHGHHIPGTVKDEGFVNVARCGGMGRCPSCTEQAQLVVNAQTKTYQRKTVQANALKFDGTRDDAIKIMDWAKVAGGRAHWFPVKKIVVVESANNSGTAEAGDWVVQENGDFFVYDDEEFNKIYEKSLARVDI